MNDEHKTREELLSELLELRTKYALQEELRAEKLTQDIIDGLPAAIVVKDREGRYLLVNTAFEQLVGARKQELIGKRAEDLFPQESAANIAGDDNQVLQAGTTVARDVSLPFQGTLRNFTLKKFPLHDDQGAVTAICAIYCDVTDRKQAEWARDEREKDYRDLTESISNLFFGLDGELRCVYWNRACEQMNGLSGGQALGKSLAELFPERSVADMERLCRSVLKSGKQQSLISELSSGKRVRSYEVTAYPSRQGVSVLARDVTSRMRAEKSLAEAQRRFYDLLAKVNLIAIILEADGTITFCNDFLLQLTGWKVEEVMGKNWFHLFMPDESAAGRLMEAARIGSIPAHYENAIKTKNGQQRLIRWNNTSLYDLRGSVSGFASIGEDVTEHRRAEEELRNKNLLLNTTLQGIPDMVYFKDRDGRILYVNAAFERIMGISAAEVLGLKGEELLADIPENLLRGDQEVLTRGIVRRGELTLQTAQGRLTLDVAKTPLIDEQGGIVGLVGVSRDITERKRMEQELLKLQKLESVGILAGGIAHDFNNLLTAILGNIGLSKMSVEADGRVARLLIAAEDACAQAKDLSYRLLTFSKGGEPLKRTVSVGRLLREAVNLALNGSKISAEFMLPEDLPSVEADEGQMKQVITNLTLNAVEAMPQGGTIRISGSTAILGGAEAVQVKPGPYLRISITDSGEGIPAENMPKIFDPYFTTREFGSQRGRGLGLAICHSIVRKHEGMITVDSEAGKGTSFHVFLPAAMRKRKDTAAGIETEGAAAKSSRTRMLVMDDEDRVRTILKEMLEYLGYDVECAREGTEAVTLYRQASEKGNPFDIVILDLTVPGGNGGVDTLRKLRREDASVRALVSSGYVDDPILRDFRNFGFIGAIAKPYDLGQLERALREILKTA